ncbi:sigma factor-like helix-turn-helix DNA-binding protein [Nonomuraea sp. NPDC052634]|uniref:sigma factor-like helix-turn-helix DNA-binding protein n=1 Tax=Nonomuraea sp. NPDC052634 TaxID=3155813 RepID=UPI00341A5E8B
MPGWPTVDRADEQELIEALRRADTEAPARLYDFYGERLHDYAYALSGDRDLAADSVHDALVTAHGCAERLKEPAKLRAWLYALTRFQVRARLAHRPGTPPAGLPLPDPAEHDDPELADLVHETLGELRRGEREVLELSLRHGLTPAEVGAVLGLTGRQSAARLSRARDHLEIAAAAVVLARTGRAHCPDLSAMVDSWEGPLTPLLRRRLSGHIGGCEVCTERRHRQVSAARLLDMVPVAYPGISLRRRVIDTCVSPELDETRELITDRGDSFDRSGFPVAHDERPRRHRSRRLGPLMLAGACLLAATGAVVVINGSDAAEVGTLRSRPAPATTPPPAEPAEEPQFTEDTQDTEDTEDTGGTEPEEEPSPSPSAGRTRSATPPPASRPAAARPRSRPAARPTATRRRPAPAAKLIATCPRSIAGTGEIGLRARNAAVSWVATASQGLEVSPESGSIRAGTTVKVRVTAADPFEPGTGRIAFTSNAGTATCTVSWQGEEIPEPPTGLPTEDDEPSAAPTSGVATSPADASGSALEATDAEALRKSDANRQ